MAIKKSDKKFYAQYQEDMAERPKQEVTKPGECFDRESFMAWLKDICKQEFNKFKKMKRNDD